MIDGFNDINSNFIVTEVGIFEGRGWNYLFENDVGNYSNEWRILYIIPESVSYYNMSGETFGEQTRKLVEDGKIIGKLSKDVVVECEQVFTNCPEIDPEIFNFSTQSPLTSTESNTTFMPV